MLPLDFELPNLDLVPLMPHSDFELPNLVLALPMPCPDLDQALPAANLDGNHDGNQGDNHPLDSC